MTYAQKYDAAVQELQRTGMWKANYNPPATRVLKAAGIRVRPPHYSRFTNIALGFGLYFAIAWGLFMHFTLWQDYEMAVQAGTSLIAGLLFGLIMATYYRISARKNNLSSWDELG